MIFAWARYNYIKYPELEKLMLSVPNGGTRNKLEAIALKRQGVKKGVSDFTIQVSRSGYHGLWVELKVNKNKASDSQNEFIEAVRKQGYYAEVVWGADDAIKLIEKYMDGKLKNT